MENLKFKASQRLIKSKTSILLLILSDIRIIRTDENIAIEYSKFTNLSKHIGNNDQFQ